MSSDRPSTPPYRRPSGLLSRFKKFNSKFLLVTGLSILIGALLNVLVARAGLLRLSDRSTGVIRDGLNAATREYLVNHIQDKAKYTNSLLGHADTDLELLASIVQRMIDEEQELEPVLQQAASVPALKDKLVYNGTSNWYQNGQDEPTVVTAWGYLGDKGTIKPEVQKAIERTALLDIIMPSVLQRGASKLQIYYVGPHEYPYARMAPYTDLGTTLDKTSQGHNDKNWYDFFFPGLVDSWQAWLADPEGMKQRKSLVTVIAPYEDAAGGGLVTTILHPLWSKDRKSFAGTVAFDLALSDIVESIKDVRLAETGFAFLSQSDGNVLAVNAAGATKLGLRSMADKSEAGVGMLKQLLKDSKEPEIKQLHLPGTSDVEYRDVMIGGADHILVLQQLRPLNNWMSDTGRIATEHWTLGFVVPKAELYQALYEAQAAVEQSRTDLVTSQSFIALGSLLILMLGVYLVARRMTGALVALSDGATRMQQGDYGVRVEVTSEDEVGQLTMAFNEMAAEIQTHTNHLEDLVQARTKELEEANKEIMSLNAQLAQENLRLGAELNVARQLQLMVLPPAQELKQIPDLDIAGFMSPADEVGGDYYDVLRGNGVVKIGIGDVTGHGLESGVLMLMVQTAVRTLLASNEKDPRRFLSIVNKVIYQNIQRISSDKNLTLSLMDYSDGVLRLTGQHEEVIIVRGSGELERVDTTGLGLPVGMDEDISDFLSNQEIRLEKGDVVVLFTDGVTEAERPDCKQYGVDRLCEVIRENHSRSAQEIKDAIIDDVMAYIGDNKIYDDITVLVIKRV